MDELTGLRDILDGLTAVNNVIDDMIYDGVLETELYDVQFSIQQAALAVEDLIQEQVDGEDFAANGFLIEEE